MLASCEMSNAYTPPDAPITYSSGSSMDVPNDPVNMTTLLHMLQLKERKLDELGHRGATKNSFGRAEANHGKRKDGA
jgi:hypothetical protein